MTKTYCIKGPRQRGATLIVALVLLTLVTLVSINGIENVTLQEKMAGNSYDRSIALQAAEAALREAEAIAEAQSKTLPANNGFPSFGESNDTDNTCPQNIINDCTNGLCVKPDKDCTERWKDATFNQWTNSSVSLATLAGTPQYFIEYLGGNYPCTNGAGYDPNNCKRYRITAVSNPGTGRARVMLQSIYATD